jgi:transcriptional regulator with XRE-family HTH domain
MQQFDISELLNAARRGAGLRSDRALSEKLRLSPTAARNWRAGTSIPTDDHLVRLCIYADIEPVPWLLWANMQRCNGPAHTTYRDLLKAWEVSAKAA